MAIVALRSSHRPTAALVKTTGQVLPSGDYGAEIEPEQEPQTHRNTQPRKKSRNNPLHMDGGDVEYQHS